MVTVSLQVNGSTRSVHVEPRTLLVHALREQLGLTGAKVGCDTSQCGACTVLLDGAAVKSCSLFAVQADGRAVTTIEGLAKGREDSFLSESLRDLSGFAVDCGSDTRQSR